MKIVLKNKYKLIDCLSYEEKVALTNIVFDIISNPVYKSRVFYLHHKDESVVEHSLRVAYRALLYGIKYNLDYESMVIGALLHDFYPTPWYLADKKPLFQKHGFTHAFSALNNSRKHYSKYMNPVVEDIIVKHMWPLNISFPRYRESLVISMIDKSTSLESFFKNPFQFGKQDEEYLKFFNKGIDLINLIENNDLLKLLKS